MEPAKINICVDKETKAAAEKLFNELGMNMTTAVNIFLKRAVIERGIPFEISLNVPNAETIAAIEEGRRIARDKRVKSYSTIEALKEALE